LTEYVIISSGSYVSSLCLWGSVVVVVWFGPIFCIFWNFCPNYISESYILLMHGQEKMHWLMEPWEVVQNHHQTIFNLRLW